MVEMMAPKMAQTKVETKYWESRWAATSASQKQMDSPRVGHWASQILMDSSMVVCWAETRAMMLASQILRDARMVHLKALH